jgi:hypothetical protein
MGRANELAAHGLAQFGGQSALSIDAPHAVF